MPNPYSTKRKPWRSEPWRSEEQDASDDRRSIHTKIFYFALLIFVVFGVLTIQLARMQLVNGEKYRLRAETNRLRELPLIPARGLIYDRNGIPLVENKATFAAAVVAADLPQTRETDITVALQEMINVPAGDIAKTIDVRRRSNDPFTPAVIKDNLTQDQAFMLAREAAGAAGRARHGRAQPAVSRRPPGLEHARLRRPHRRGRIRRARQPGLSARRPPRQDGRRVIL